MKTAFETHVEIGGQVLLRRTSNTIRARSRAPLINSQSVSGIAGAFVCSGARHDIRITPGRIDFSNRSIVARTAMILGARSEPSAIRSIRARDACLPEAWVDIKPRVVVSNSSSEYKLQSVVNQTKV